jgi:hypothetical protein
MAVPHRFRAALCCMTMFALAGLVIGACGGASHPPSVVTSAAAGGGTGATAADPPGHSGYAAAGRDILSAGTVVHRPIRGTGGHERNDENAGRAGSGNATASGLDPCTLVSKAAARVIIGAPIATPQEAPLGPTCIYRRLGAEILTTVAVESVAFVRIEPQIRQRTRVTVAGHTGYCGIYGRPTTYVPLADGQVLNIAAPCAVGLRFAEKALSSLDTHHTER